LIILAAIIGLVIIGVSLYWLYKILSNNPQTIEKQESQETVMTVDKFSSQAESLIEKINPIDYSKINFNTKLDEIQKSLKLKKYNQLSNDLVIVGQYLINKINKITNQTNFRDSLEKLYFIGRNDIAEEFVDTYNKIIELSYYDYDETGLFKISESDLENKVNLIVDKLRNLNSMINTLKV